MNDRKCVVLAQHRSSSNYNDFIGKFYHFPSKYLKILSSNNIEFIYFEPTTKKGSGSYFGYGKLGKIFEDKREKRNYFIEIIDYKPFSKDVPFLNENDKPRELGPSYNPQNAVRKISGVVVDEVCLDGGIFLNFRADTHLIKVLGEQLIASEKVGVLELIKNAYDAQATYSKVIIEKIDSISDIDSSIYEFGDYEGPVIVVEDDGIGMTRETIENGWLRPASTLKTNIKQQLQQERAKAVESGKLGAYNSLIKQLKKEHKNRIPLGEKGVGRFATHRLGRKLIIKTKVSNFNYEYVLKIDWDKFDLVDNKGIDLDSIGVELTRQGPSIEYGEKGSGTQVIIYGGREGFEWNESVIEDLNRSISSLNSPNPYPNKNYERFYAYLVCPQLPDLKNYDLGYDYGPVFSFDGIVDENGILEYTLNFTPPRSVPMPKDKIEDDNYDLKKSQVAYWKEPDRVEFRKPECGAFYMHVDVWYRSKQWIDGPDRSNFLQRLDNYGGISIYRDNINIFPAEWGSETDWLELKTRHIKKGAQLSYYNFIGNIELDQTANPNLIDKTDREGLLKNRGYNDLTKLTQAILLNLIENRFKSKRDAYNDLTKDVIREPKLLGNYVRQGARIVGNIKSKYPIKKDPYDLLVELGEEDAREERLVNLERSINNLQKSLETFQQTQDLLTEQAGFGLTIAISIHEIAKITANFYNGISMLLKKGFKDEKKLIELKNSSSSLQTELKRLQPLRVVRSEKKVEFNILKAINYALKLFKKRFIKLNIEIEINEGNGFLLYTRYGAVIQIFSNLFDNACYWLETTTDSHRKLKVLIDTNDRTVIVADTGPGIHNSILPDLFKPGYSLKIPPSGLGLYICKYYMQTMRGDIYLTHRKELLQGYTGAQFTIDFHFSKSFKEDQ